MNSSTHSDSPLPFVAPCRRVPVGAPLEWLRQGWRDMRSAPTVSVAYGVALTALSAVIAIVAWRLGMLALYLGLASGFVFLGPFLAMGLYSISYQLQMGRRPTLAFSVGES